MRRDERYKLSQEFNKNSKSDFLKKSIIWLLVGIGLLGGAIFGCKFSEKKGYKICKAEFMGYFSCEDDIKKKPKPKIKPKPKPTFIDCGDGFVSLVNKKGLNGLFKETLTGKGGIQSRILFKKTPDGRYTALKIDYNRDFDRFTGDRYTGDFKLFYRDFHVYYKKGSLKNVSPFRADNSYCLNYSTVTGQKIAKKYNPKYYIKPYVAKKHPEPGFFDRFHWESKTSNRKYVGRLTFK